MIFVSPSCVKRRYVMSNPFFMKADRHLWPSNWVPLATNIISIYYIYIYNNVSSKLPPMQTAIFERSMILFIFICWFWNWMRFFLSKSEQYYSCVPFLTWWRESPRKYAFDICSLIQFALKKDCKYACLSPQNFSIEILFSG